MFKNSKRLYFVVLATLLIALGKVQGSAFVFDEEAAVKSFEKRFGHCEAMPYWGVSVPREHGVINSLTENHRNIIFGGRGVDGYGQYGTGNATHYTVNILNDAKPDLLADMNQHN